MTEEKKLNGKAIYSPKGAAAEYGKVGCNFYNGCPHNCSYCYLKRGVTSKTLGKTDVTLKKCFRDEQHALEVFHKELFRDLDYLKQTGIFFSFSTDPLIEQTRLLTLCAAKAAVAQGVPVKILTKAADFYEWICILGELREEQRRMIAFGFTLTGCDEMEPGAPSNVERIQAMEELHFCGFRTFASIEPVINPRKSFEMIESSAHVCDLYLIGLLSGVKADYYDIEDIVRLFLLVKEMCKWSIHDIKVYWKESVRNYFRKHGWQIGDDPNFVEAEYDMFKEEKK